MPCCGMSVRYTAVQGAATQSTGTLLLHMIRWSGILNAVLLVIVALNVAVVEQLTAARWSVVLSVVVVPVAMLHAAVHQ